MQNPWRVIASRGADRKFELRRRFVLQWLSLGFPESGSIADVMNGERA